MLTNHARAFNAARCASAHDGSTIRSGTFTIGPNTAAAGLGIVLGVDAIEATTTGVTRASIEPAGALQLPPLAGDR